MAQTETATSELLKKTKEDICSLDPNEIDDIFDALVFIRAKENSGEKQESLAKYLGVGASTINGLLKGTRRISDKMLESIAKSEGADYYELLSRRKGELTRYREKDIANGSLCREFKIVIEGIPIELKGAEQPGKTLKEIIETLQNTGVLKKPEDSATNEGP